MHRYHLDTGGQVTQDPMGEEKTRPMAVKINGPWAERAKWHQQGTIQIFAKLPQKP